MYNNTPILRYDLTGPAKAQVNPNEEFDEIDSYFEAIKPYVYDHIKMTDHTESIEKAFQSRLQTVVSSQLYRSLLLKEGAVIALNTNNIPSYYAIIKSFLEIAAVLGYLAYSIKNQSDYNEMIEKINKIGVGNRPAGSLSVGSIEITNIMTMFDKAGKFINEIKPLPDGENILLTIYSDVCNYGHPNFNAHLPVGISDPLGVWNAKIDTDTFKTELWAFYMPAFTTGISFISLFASSIQRMPQVNTYNLMNSPKLFT